MTPATDPDTGLPTGTPPGDISIPVYYNPLINLGNAYYNTNTNRNLSSVYAQISILDGLSFRSEFGPGHVGPARGIVLQQQNPA